MNKKEDWFVIGLGCLAAAGLALIVKGYGNGRYYDGRMDQIDDENKAVLQFVEQQKNNQEKGEA